jgi:hypothetical protein
VKLSKKVLRHRLKFLPKLLPKQRLKRLAEPTEA